MLKLAIKSDLYRYGKGVNAKAFWLLYRKQRMFKFVVWLRIAQHFHKKKTFLIAKLAKWYYYRLSLKYSIDFPVTATVGLGLKVNHGMGLVVNSRAVIGNNVDLSHGVTIATEKGGCPVIGDKVRISPGAVLVGGIVVGNNVVIGANCVVTKSIPDNDVAVGIPNKNLGRSFEEFSDRHYFSI